MDESTEKATLGGGCFWCLEAVFQELEGVLHVESGYTGGHVDNPTYRQICTGTTGHAEVVRLEYDPSVVDFRTILEVFFATHDPTTLNRQGADTGTQYRSAIFAHDPTQRSIAEQLIAELTADQLFDAPIVTEVSDLPEYYGAEGYHQNYYRDNTQQGYCQAVISPKLAKFRQRFASRLRHG
ncbi:MAG: peptide-methionine (S)-S-oxide reductase MsrA [Acidobacteria bacterium]|nr:peptide-methionine (S)-S-oxide reductase MsrA [Acidobacteriota bacterium]